MQRNVTSVTLMTSVWVLCVTCKECIRNVLYMYHGCITLNYLHYINTGCCSCSYYCFCDCLSSWLQGDRRSVVEEETPFIGPTANPKLPFKQTEAFPIIQICSREVACANLLRLLYSPSLDQEKVD
jgi:hypothetical protein